MFGYPLNRKIRLHQARSNYAAGKIHLPGGMTSMRGPRASIHPLHFHVQYPENGRTFREIRFQAGGAKGSRTPLKTHSASPALTDCRAETPPQDNVASRVRFRRVEPQLDVVAQRGDDVHFPIADAFRPPSRACVPRQSCRVSSTGFSCGAPRKIRGGTV